MPFERPSLPQLIERAQADIESTLPGADARTRRSNLSVLARVLSGLVHSLFGYLAWMFLQVFPDTAESEHLDRHAALWLPEGRKPAAYAVGQITVTGTPGAIITAGTVWKRADGVMYANEAEATIAAGGSVLVTVVAEAEGQVGNAAAGIALMLDSPIVGVNAQATVTAGALTGGADMEDDESLRTRVIERIQQAPHGGARFDYVSWALEVPGVTRAWCSPLEMGDGTVTLRFVRDDDASLLPDANEVAAVQMYIDALRPVGMHLYVVAPVAHVLNFEIQITPATAAVKAAVEAELRDLLLREAVPELGAGEGKVLLSHLREAVSLAAGETDHVMLAPTADVAPVRGAMVVFGAITWR